MTILNKAIFFIILFVSAALAALTELEKIDALIAAVEHSNVTFIRNGTSYSSAEAADHLRSKLNAAVRSPFSPKKNKWTALLFIEKIGSKSSASGKDYIIKLPDGTQVKAKDWLLQKLKEIEAANP